MVEDIVKWFRPTKRARSAIERLQPMSNTLADGIQILTSAKGTFIIYWAVATQREGAVDRLQQVLPPGWVVTLTDRHITQDQVAALNLCPGGVRQLKYALMEVKP